MSEIILALVQMSMGRSREDNLQKAETLIRQAESGGANIVLLPELFESRYFCQLEREEFFSQAHPLQGHPFLGRFQRLAAELEMVLPVPFFERAGQAYFNSLAVIDADGAILGIYRKSHIPDGPGYEEKFYFNPGDSGFRAWQTRYGSVGCGICWDQWFPECARVLALRGADLLLYPTAIGSEPVDQVLTPNTSAMWQRAMVGHAVCNACYLGAANRVGKEEQERASCDFYGHSFICNYQGEILSELGPLEEGLALAELDLEAARIFRAGMGFFRDRRPELYAPLLTLDGNG
jgi:N-carbamoylputrescine amidase